MAVSALANLALALAVWRSSRGSNTRLVDAAAAFLFLLPLAGFRRVDAVAGRPSTSGGRHAELRVLRSGCGGWHGRLRLFLFSECSRSSPWPATWACGFVAGLVLA